MLVMIRLFPKSGMKPLWAAIESEVRNLYSKDISPIYAIQIEGKRYITLGLDVKNLEAVNDVFMKNINTMASVRKTETVPVMMPTYFRVEEGIHYTLDRFVTFLRVEPEAYDSVYKEIQANPKSGQNYLSYMSYSFGDDDIVISLFSEDREKADDFVKSKIGTLPGVLSYDFHRVVKYVPLMTKEHYHEHKDMFLYAKAGSKSMRLKNPGAYSRYLKERSPTVIIVRMWPKRSTSALWKEVEDTLGKSDSKKVIPLYVSQAEARPYMSVIFQACNFEVLKDFLVKQVSKMKNVKKTRTVPLLSPTYFMLPAGHPEDLHRFLVSLKVCPKDYQTVRSQIVSTALPENTYITYLSYSMGDDDLLFSMLAESRKAAQAFVDKNIGELKGVSRFDISKQVKTSLLATKPTWRKHQRKFLSDFDKEHIEEYDRKYDWATINPDK